MPKATKAGSSNQWDPEQAEPVNDPETASEDAPDSEVQTEETKPLKTAPVKRTAARAKRSK